MKAEWNTREYYDSFKDELFEGDIRKVDELIAQLELWSDTKTINHKMEQVRLEEYVELSKNLYELQEKLMGFIALSEQEDENKELAHSYKELVEEKFNSYIETENIIHNWIHDIKELDTIIAKSQLLWAHKDMLNEIVNN